MSTSILGSTPRDIPQKHSVIHQVPHLASMARGYCAGSELSPPEQTFVANYCCALTVLRRSGPTIAERKAADSRDRRKERSGVSR
jgi:hypothetical protein